MCQSEVKHRGVGQSGEAPLAPQLEEKLPSVKELRDAVPKHCFERSALKSTFFLLRDAAFVAAFGYLAYNTLSMDLTLVNLFLWGVYAVCQGTIMTSLWVVGHECGHYAYSSSNFINDFVGFFTHSALLVPYFSWQRTHKVHHAKCNHLLDGESHVPDLKRKVHKLYTKVLDAVGEDAFVLLQIILHLGFGWLMYLFWHATGSRRSPVTKQRYSKKPNHFSPFASNELFPEHLRFKVFLSSAGIFGMLAILAYASTIYGLKTVALMYGGPYLIVNAWLVGYTWLQHSDASVPHFGEDEWSWLRGAVNTIDRPYPWIIDELHHHIGSTHVCHHIFHELPHYHAQEATKALIPVLKSHYKYDPAPIHKALWKTARDCHYVEELDGVQYPKSIIHERRTAKKL
uniref:Delta12 desaturase n=1 Tax=Parietichytrium sp. TaxID=1689869 RepID=A0A809VLX4_9STRA|nr:delta12 desaturase [Parietichytrium sp.]